MEAHPRQRADTIAAVGGIVAPTHWLRHRRAGIGNGHTSTHSRGAVSLPVTVDKIIETALCHSATGTGTQARTRLVHAGTRAKAIIVVGSAIAAAHGSKHGGTRRCCAVPNRDTFPSRRCILNGGIARGQGQITKLGRCGTSRSPVAGAAGLTTRTIAEFVDPRRSTITVIAVGL